MKRAEKTAFEAVGLRIMLFAGLMVLLVSFSASRVWGDETILVATGATWKYLDDGSDQGTAWKEPGFIDAAWLAGPAELGYGDGDESTVVNCGPSAPACNANNHITTYFRHSFDVADASVYNSLTLRVLRDDGAVVYVNGAEVFRTNMPGGAVTYTTLAFAGIGGAAETVFHMRSVDPGLLADGTNVVAVEIHQFRGNSSDISFDLQLIGSTSLLTRGPYMQMATPTSVVVRWRTAAATDSRVKYGPDPASLNTTVDDAALTTEHETALADLDSDTKYYYSVGTTAETLAGGDASHYFITSPTAGTPRPVRVWVIGDSGTANSNAEAVRDAYLAFTGADHTDVWLTVGDNAYLTGTDDLYQAALFDMYPMLLRNTVLWPALGNHDSEPHGVSSSDGTGPYFDMFTLPAQAQAGGLPSTTEAYYSFDYGNIHFVCLNSTGSDRSLGGPMLSWLKGDLAATKQDWIIAYWHHAPYTHGSHDSDNPADSGGRMFDMRENVLPILEQAGVDLVLTGHSHSYERSFLLKGHYDTSDTLTPEMVMDSGDGRSDGSGAYYKSNYAHGTYQGTVYVVAGSSGLTSGGSLDHPAMFFSSNTLGSMVLVVNDNQLDATFINSNGDILDYFTIIKGPLCNIIMSQDSYTDAEMITAPGFRIANPGPDAMRVELKVWLGLPSFLPISYLNLGADGSLILPSGFDIDLGPVAVIPFPVWPGMPRGEYEFSIRMMDPITGELLAEDRNAFTVVEP
ncbi:MAG: purple acid phosphatase family protein [Planctomycetota bacterium]|jgi:hypothetical protein